MSDKLRESVSALIDGEADELELRRLLTTEDFDTARQTWSDFHRSRGALFGVNASIAQLDISGRVRSALEAEVQETGAQEIGARTARTPRWWRPVTSVAVAASMAAVVVVGIRGMAGGDATAGASSGIAVAASDIRAESVSAASGAGNFANAGRVFAPVPLRGNTVSANYGGVPTHLVPAQTYTNAQSRAEAEALMRRRLQQYLLMQAESSQVAESNQSR